jgi:uncharacterized protein (TIGR02444 family)
MTLWNFALALYARPGVETACLAAQDAGADVCLLLCGAWLDGRGTRFQADCASALRKLAGERQANLIEPLRNARQQLREPASREPELERLRKRIKAMELAAERQLLEQLERVSEPFEQECAAEPDAYAAGSEWLSALAAPLTAEHPSLQLIQRQRLAVQGQAG